MGGRIRTADGIGGFGGRLLLLLVGGGWGEDFVDQAVVGGFLGAKELVAFDVLGDLLGGLAGVPGEEVVELVAGLEDGLGLDLDVGRLAVDPAVGLVDHDLGVGEAVAFALGAGGEGEGPAGHGLAQAVGCDVAVDVSHGVDDGECVVDGPAGGVDVEVDVLAGLLVGEVEESHDDAHGGAGVDFADEEDDAVFEQELVDGHLAGALERAGELWRCEAWVVGGGGAVVAARVGGGGSEELGGAGHECEGVLGHGWGSWG